MTDKAVEAAWGRFPEERDQDTGQTIDDWGYAEAQRAGFIQGWGAARPIILNEISEMLENRAHELSADRDDRLAAELYQWARKLGSDDD